MKAVSRRDLRTPVNQDQEVRAAIHMGQSTRKFIESSRGRAMAMLVRHFARSHPACRAKSQGTCCGHLSLTALGLPGSTQPEGEPERAR